MDVDTLKNYDFLVNRRMPLCEKKDGCNAIWNSFSFKSDEGADWSALWPRTAGRIINESTNVYEVKVSVGGSWDVGFLPKKLRGLPIEDYGFISRLDKKYPLYKFSEEDIKELNSPCGDAKTTSSGTSTLEKVEKYAKISANGKLDIAAGLKKAVPPLFAKRILDFLGLSASISAEAFIDGRWKTETTTSTTDTLTYGRIDEAWEVKSVWVERRTGDPAAVNPYQPYGTLLLRKVFSCDGGQPTEMTFASFMLAEFGSDEAPAPIPESVSLKDVTVKDIGVPNRPLDRGLVSVNTQTEHAKLVDFFLNKNIPKSIANFFIKEINVAGSR